MENKLLKKTFAAGNAGKKVENKTAPVVPATNARVSPKPGTNVSGSNVTFAPKPAPTPPPANNTSGIPTSPVQVQPYAPEVPLSEDQLYEQRIRELLGGVRDTKEEEDLLRQQMLRDVGAGQANLNARMGAAGMGTSGALSGLSTDMRARAAFDAANSIAGLRQDARDEAARNAATGIGLINQDRNLDINEARYQQYLDMINEQFGDGKPTTGDDGKVDLSQSEVGDKWTNDDGTITEVVENGNGGKSVVIHPAPSTGNPFLDWLENIFSHSKGKVE